jgi:hypothetical protein
MEVLFNEDSEDDFNQESDINESCQSEKAFVSDIADKAAPESLQTHC